MSETRQPSQQPAPQSDAPVERKRRPWVEPSIEELPPLTELTLQTGSPIPGGGDTGGGGSTVF